MHRVKLFHSDTYSEDINTVRESLYRLPEEIKREIIDTEFLCDYMSNVIWKEEHPIYSLHQELMKALCDCEVVLYHNTRLFDKSTVLSKGLIFSDDRYIQILRAAMKANNISEMVIESAIDRVLKQINRWNEGNNNRRKNQICYIYDMDYYFDYDKFLSTFGGEFVEFGLLGNGEETIDEYKKIAKIGKPYVVEFIVPYGNINKFEKMDIARYMLEEWIHLGIRKDEVAHQYDGWIDFEVPAKDIIDIHEVEDYFPDLDDYFGIRKSY